MKEILMEEMYHGGNFMEEMYQVGNFMEEMSNLSAKLISNYVSITVNSNVDSIA